MRIDEELHRRITAACPTPDTDQEEHRDQHDLPEDIEQEEIQCREHAQYTRLQYQQQTEIKRCALGDIPRIDSHQKAKQRGQHKERQRETVKPHRIRYAKSREPLGKLSELKALGGFIIIRQHHHTADECQQRAADGNISGKPRHLLQS